MTTQQSGSSRLGRHLLARLKHAAYRDLRQVFCELDLLSHTEVDIDGCPTSTPMRPNCIN